MYETALSQLPVGVYLSLALEKKKPKQNKKTKLNLATLWHGV